MLDCVCGAKPAESNTGTAWFVACSRCNLSSGFLHADRDYIRREWDAMIERRTKAMARFAPGWTKDPKNAVDPYLAMLQK